MAQVPTRAAATRWEATLRSAGAPPPTRLGLNSRPQAGLGGDPDTARTLKPFLSFAVHQVAVVAGHIMLGRAAPRWITARHELDILRQGNGQLP